MDDRVNDKLKELKIEDFVWVIYIGIILLSWYSNSLERKYFIYNDLCSKEKYQRIVIFIFLVLVVIYFYFFKSSYDDIKDLSYSDSLKKKRLTYLSFISSLLILISGLIYLYIAVVDDNIDVELAFN